MGLLAQYRGGARFCTRGGVLNYSFRDKVFEVRKNRDTMCECPAAAGPACAAITNLSWWPQGFRGTEANDLYRPVVRSFYSYSFYYQYC